MNDIRPEYENLTMGELLLLYSAPNSLPVPDELRGWVECAEMLADVIEQRKRNEEGRQAAQGDA